MAAYRLGMSAESLHRESTNSLIVARETEFGIVQTGKELQTNSSVYLTLTIYTVKVIS